MFNIRLTKIKRLLLKTVYGVTILLGLEIVSGLSSHLVMFLTRPSMIADGQYQMALCQLAAYALWGGILILFLIRHFDKKKVAFAKTALKILILYCLALLATVVIVERLMLGKLQVAEYLLFIVLNFLSSPATATLAFFQPSSLLLPIISLFPFVLVLTVSYIYTKPKDPSLIKQNEEREGTVQKGTF